MEGYPLYTSKHSDEYTLGYSVHILHIHLPRLHTAIWIEYIGNRYRLFRVVFGLVYRYMYIEILLM